MWAYQGVIPPETSGQAIPPFVTNSTSKNQNLKALYKKRNVALVG